MALVSRIGQYTIDRPYAGSIRVFCEAKWAGHGQMMLAAGELAVEFGQKPQSYCLRAPGSKHSETRLCVMLRKGDSGKLIDKFIDAHAPSPRQAAQTGVFVFWYPNR